MAQAKRVTIIRIDANVKVAIKTVYFTGFQHDEYAGPIAACQAYNLTFVSPIFTLLFLGSVDNPLPFIKRSAQGPFGQLTTAWQD